MPKLLGTLADAHKENTPHLPRQPSTAVEKKLGPAANTMQGAFDEHLKIIAALKDNYGRNDDASSIAHVAEVQREVEAACRAKEDKVAALVKGASFSRVNASANGRLKRAK